MFKTILVATDGSDHALKAQRIAADLAEKYSAKLVILSVVDDREPTPEELRLVETEYAERLRQKVPAVRFEEMRGFGLAALRPMVEAYSELATQIRETVAEALLEEAEHEARRKGVREVVTRIGFGQPAKIILDVAREVGADLIVMGSRGLSDLKALVLGSVSHKVMNAAESTVMAVK